MIAAARVAEEEGIFEVWQDNYDTLVMFTRLQTQWNNTNGVFIGLNYQAVAALLTIYAVPEPAAMMDDLIAMEHAALPYLNTKD